jgi:glycosyltransferase involved in cell wall biosynthesis
MKKVLFITNYFYPEYASLGQLMTDLCTHLKDQFELSVIAMTPGYTDDIRQKYEKVYSDIVNFEEFQNIKVYRVFTSKQDKSSKLSRILHIGTYFVNSIIAIIKSGKQDVVFCVSQPPVLGGLLGLAAKIFKRSMLIYNIQDFNPEQIEAVGYSKKQFLINLLRLFDNITLRISDSIVLVGRDQEETLKKRFKEYKGTLSSKVCCINNWIDQNIIFPIKEDDNEVIALKQQYGLNGKKVFMYSGNLGLFYDLMNLVKIMEKFDKRQDVVFVFAGDGALKDNLLAYCNTQNLKNIVFVPYQEKEKLIYSLNMADVHIVTNAKGIKGVSVPSKIYGIMAVGKPIIGILESGSEAQRIISESGCGLCAEPGDCNAIEILINIFIDKDKQNLLEMGTRGRTFLEENFSMEKSIEKYNNLIKTL